MNFEKQLARALEALMPEAASAAETLTQYVSLVEAWNRKIDLTAAKTPSALVDILIADSLVMARRDLVPEGAQVLDVGSGAGGPAVALSIVRPDVRVTMLEPIGKRVAFLRTVIGTLGLSPRVTALDGRIDAGKPTPSGDFTVASARATFAPEEWLRIGATLAPSVLVFTTGEAPTSEGTRQTTRHDYRLPGGGSPRALLRFDRA